MTTPLGNTILDLRDKGHSYRQIANMLGCSLSTVSFHCGEGQKIKNRERSRNRANKKRQYVQEIKQNGVCTDCKQNYPYFVM